MKRFLCFLAVGTFFFGGLAAVISACGSNSSGGNPFTAAAGSVTQAQALSISSTMENAAKVSFTSPPESPTVRGETFASCSTKDPATAVDADGDGIPLKQVTTFNCKNISTGASSTASASGTRTVIDHDDTPTTGIGAGYRFEDAVTTSYTYTGSGSNVSSSTTYSGFFDLTKSTSRTTTWAFTSSWQESTTGTLNSAAFSGSYGSTWNNTITVDDTGHPGNSGTVQFNGFWGWIHSGTFPGREDRATSDINVVFKVTGTDLKYDSVACSGIFWKSGTITWTDGAGNTFAITYGCTTKTCKYNGTAVTGGSCS